MEKATHLSVCNEYVVLFDKDIMIENSNKANIKARF
jgi:hypothetical protein